MSTRDTILQTIKAYPKANVDALAEAASVSPVTVRHHLNALQAAGLIESQSVRRKVGRPYYVYNLSEKGQELFPKRYVRLTSRLLDELKIHLPSEALSDVLSNVVESVLVEHRGEFEHLDVEDRLDYLVALLADEGFLAHWEKTDGGYLVPLSSGSSAWRRELIVWRRNLARVTPGTDAGYWKARKRPARERSSAAISSKSSPS